MFDRSEVFGALNLADIDAGMSGGNRLSGNCDGIQTDRSEGENDLQWLT
jgi:hypothetical protein